MVSQDSNDVVDYVLSDLVLREYKRLLIFYVPVMVNKSHERQINVVFIKQVNE